MKVLYFSMLFSSSSILRTIVNMYLNSDKSLNDVVDNFISELFNEIDLINYLNDNVFKNIEISDKMINIANFLSKTLKENIEGYLGYCTIVKQLRIVYQHFGEYGVVYAFAVNERRSRKEKYYTYCFKSGLCKFKLKQYFTLTPFEKLVKNGVFEKYVFRKDIKNIRIVRTMYVPRSNNVVNCLKEFEHWLKASFLAKFWKEYLNIVEDRKKDLIQTYNILRSARDSVETVLACLQLCNKFAKYFDTFYETKEEVLHKLVNDLENYYVIKEVSINRNYYLVVFETSEKKWMFHIPTDRVKSGRFKQKLIGTKNTEYVKGTSGLNPNNLPSEVFFTITRILTEYLNYGFKDSFVYEKNKMVKILEQVINEEKIVNDVKNIVKDNKKVVKYLRRYKSGKEILKLIT